MPARAMAVRGKKETPPGVTRGERSVTRVMLSGDLQLR